MPDKFLATWISHSSLSDFLKCPRAYYLKNVYRDPQTRHKIQLMSPPMALGSAVHEVVEALSVLPTDGRFKESLLKKFDAVWKKYTGKQGGFLTAELEQQYKQRGEAMLRRIMDHPGPLTRLAVKIQEDLPYYWLSEADEIILCGKVDWLEYLPTEDAVHIIDFKTSKSEEDVQSLQLPIYYLLVSNTQKRKVARLSYWYLELSDELSEKPLPDAELAHEQVLSAAKQVKLARKLERFKCPQGETGCYVCRPLERVIRGEAEQVGVNRYNQDIYIVDKSSQTDIEQQSVIL